MHLRVEMEGPAKQLVYTMPFPFSLSHSFPFPSLCPLAFSLFSCPFSLVLFSLYHLPFLSLSPFISAMTQLMQRSTVVLMPFVNMRAAFMSDTVNVTGRLSNTDGQTAAGNTEVKPA